MTNKPLILLTGQASEHCAGEIIDAHSHDTHQIVHALNGVMRVSTNGGTWIVPPERGLWVPARTSHEIHCIGLLGLRTVYLDGDHQSFPSVVQVTVVSALMREIMVRVAEGAEPHQLPHLTALLVDEIAALTFESLHLPRAKDERIARLGVALLEDPADPTSLRSWASRLNLSPRTLIRRIKDETGMSFRELRRQTRILVALERLSLGESVTNVAMDVGYDSPSAFTQAFRAVTGKTPSRYI